MRGGKVLNVNTRSIDQIDIGIIGDSFVLDSTDGTLVIDITGSYIAPGFIDAHMHVESTLLPPSTFASLSVPRGTTGVVLDPHEIANVYGD